MNLGTTNVSKLFIGENEVSAVRLGDDLVWESVSFDLIVSGTLTPDVTGGLLISGTDSFGKNTYESLDGNVKVFWFDPSDLGVGQYYMEHYTDSTLDAQWRSGFTNTATWSNPSQATGWTATFQATGVPVFTIP